MDAANSDVSRADERAELRAWQERWKLVNEAEVEELRTLDFATRLRQACAMFDSARALGWEHDRTEDEKVWERWRLLRERMRVEP